jgi:hypothetical protein
MAGRDARRYQIVGENGRHGGSFRFSISDGQMDIILGTGSILAHDNFMIDLHAATK